MSETPQQRHIYHITHIDNLPMILADGGLWSDFEASRRSAGRTVIGYQEIKRRRLEELPVPCHPGTFVGHFVPFYFCPRSPMLYVIHCRNPDLTFQGGQERIVHLVSTVRKAVATGRNWAFTDGNAGTRYTQFSNDLARIDEFVDWKAVNAHYWSDRAIKEKKQAEFLVHRHFPWKAFGSVGVINDVIAAEVRDMLSGANHRPKVESVPNWYY